MATTTFDTSSDQPTPEQIAAEQAALKQGEKILAMQEEDRERAFQQTDDENTDASLIGGKFKSQDDLLKAYEELQKKLGSKDTEGEEQEPSDGTETPQEEPEEQVEEVSKATSIIRKASAAFDEAGDLSEETIEELSNLDSKELIKAYLSQYKQSAEQQQVVQMQEAEVDALVKDFGGPERYGEMISWAGENLSADEIAQYNAATNANSAAARFAMMALQQRYEAVEGYEAPLVSGRRAAPKVQGYRSNAELARDINDPRYQSDPAFRADVEAKLSKSTDLL